MKNIGLIILFLSTFLSCKSATSDHLKVEEENATAAVSEQQANFIYKEVATLKKSADYSSELKVKTLALQDRTLAINIRYIADRAYIAMGNGSNAQLNWQPLKVNFYYDISPADAEKDMHLLLKGNDPAKGYILFPAFTEQYASYFVYYFEQNGLSYLGNYEATDFGKGAFSFNEQSKELSRSPGSKLIKIAETDSIAVDHTAEDLALLKGDAAKGDQLKYAVINKEWLGTYNGSFLRLKDESADPRAWGTISVTVGRESVKFHLDTYNENVEKELKVVFADAQKVRFVAGDNDKQVLTLLLDKNKYKLSGNLMEEIVGERATYELEKK